MKVIAISGWAKSGKDTAALTLIKDHGATRVAFADILKDMTADQYSIDRTMLDDQARKEVPLEMYPVNPKDAFSLNLAKFLYREFRTVNGKRPIDFHIDVSGAFVGVTDHRGTTEQLYWTPRALAILEGSVKRTVDSSYWVQKTIDGIYNESEDPSWNTINNDWNSSNLFVIPDLRYKSEISQLRSVFGDKLVTVRVNRFDSTESKDPSENDLNDAKFDVIIENKGTLEEFLAKVKELV